MSGSGVPGPKTWATPISRSLGTSDSGMMPPIKTPTWPRSASRSSWRTARRQGHVGAAEDAEAQPVGVLVGDGADDGLRRLPQAGVDDVHAGVAQGAGHDLDAAVVAVQADLGEHDADGGCGDHWAVPGEKISWRTGAGERGCVSAPSAHRF